MVSETIWAFFVYFLALLTIGLVSYKKQNSSADFIVGDRSLNFWVIALSAHASDMSSWLFLAFPAMLYLGGVSQLWAGIGLLMGMFLNWQFIAKKLRASTEKLDSYTLPSFFEKKIGDTTGLIRITTALMSVIFLTCYLAAGLMGMGLLLDSIFSINYYWGLTLATGVVIAYTYVGGFTTVAWTDLFQAIFLLGVVFIVPLVAFFQLPNGLESIHADTIARQIDMTFLPSLSTESILTTLFLVFGWGLGYFGQPHIVTKFMGIRNTEELTKSKYLGMLWMVATLGSAAMIGIVGISFFPGVVDKPELIFVEMVKQLFHPFIAGIFLCGVISATMSTMDSQILVAAAVLSEDLYMRLRKQKISPKQHLMITRLSVIVISLTSLLISFNKSSTIMDSVYYAWAGLGCAFGPLMLMSLYYKNVNTNGAIAGILVGGVLSGTWHWINPYVTNYSVPAMIPGFLLSTLSIYAVSRYFAQEPILEAPVEIIET